MEIDSPNFVSKCNYFFVKVLSLFDSKGWLSLAF